MKTIIVAVDFSSPSRKAFAFAVNLARQMNAEVIAIYITEFSDLRIAIRMNLYGSGETTAAIKKVVDSHIQKQFERLVRLYGDSYERIRFIRKRGIASEEIVKVAKKHAAYMIVTGSRARRKTAELVLGSTAHAIIRYAPCPVTVVRQNTRVKIPAKADE